MPHLLLQWFFGLCERIREGGGIRYRIQALARMVGHGHRVSTGDILLRIARAVKVHLHDICSEV